ncbi:TonB-dependent receptor [Steroidobacter sp.]|uniref:TonB-dependent receptor n=1 Tax=Steroidobacter sp. TaxID=1978227 RepID=UPI001A4C0711|nr:TonB-dependent receptor [Steroidobacter sp.]MBL8271778.1 TonB-dependent receptor [Steroidobacter sp.]
MKIVKGMDWRGGSRGIWSTSLAAAVAGVMAGSCIPSGAFAGSLYGRVSDAAGVKSLQSAAVEIVELKRRAQTGSDGSFRFSDVPDGTYTLRTQYIGAPALDTTVNVSGDTRSADIMLGAGGSDASYIDNVLVVGQRASLSSALSRQRSADGVESVLSRDGIGQFPDQNAAESLRRVAGINVLNDQGEGRFVAVRGLSPDLNAASINGARVPAPEADVRSVALDVIPAELIESIEIKKSLTPDMDGDTIGASIEINTTSAFDRKQPFLSFSGEGSFNELNSEWSPKGSLDFSTTLGDRFGIAGGLSYYKREFSTDNVEMDGWSESEDGVAFAESVEYRDYDVERQRLGGSLSLDYRLSDATTLYARFLRSEFEDQEYRGRLIFEMGEEPNGGGANSADFSDQDGEVQVVRDIKDRFEKQTISTLNVGGETFAGAWTFKYNGSWSTAKEREAGSLDPVEFQREFEGEGLDVSFDYSNWLLPRYSLSGASAAAVSDASEFEFDKIERTSLSLAEDEELAARFDISREFALSDGQFTLQFGAKARQREKTYDKQVDVFDGFDGDLTLADVVGSPSYGLNAIGPVPDGRAVRNFISANLADFELNAADTAFESSIADYSVDEDVYAGYVLGRLDQGSWRVVGGVRVEQTRNDIRANAVTLVEGDDDVEIDVTPTRFERDYTYVLPSLNVRFQANEELLLRGGLYRSLVRPQIGQLAPRFVLEDDEGEFGNPNLKPYDAWNLDLSAEWYLGNSGVLQAGVFFKRIEDFIVNVRYEDGGEFLGIAFDEALIPQNGDQAKVKGVELNYQQALSFLPAPMDGVLLGFNYTYTDAEGEIDGVTVALPASAENTFNASLGYEKGPLSLRLTASYRDKYLDELGESRGEDRYVEDHIQYDLTARYRVTPQFQVFAEVVNLGDEPYVAYQDVGGRKRLLQYEEYSWTGKTGFRYTF